MANDKSNKGQHAPSGSGSAQPSHLKAYNMFRSEVKEQAMQEYEEKNKGRAAEGKADLKKPNVTQLAARKWAKLSDSEKQAYYNKV